MTCGLGCLADLEVVEVPAGPAEPRPDDVARDAAAHLADLEDVGLLHAIHEPGKDRTDFVVIGLKQWSNFTQARKEACISPLSIS